MEGFLLVCSRRYNNLLPTYPYGNKEIRAFVVRGTTVGWCFLMNNCLDRILKAKRRLVYSRRRLKH